jgi:hypothetical protein
MKAHCCRLSLGLSILLFVGIFLLSGCAAAATMAPAASEQAAPTEGIEATELPAAQATAAEPTLIEPTRAQSALDAQATLASETEAGKAENSASQSYAETQAAPTLAPTLALPASTPQVELRVMELEWPEQIRLGDSDVIRLSLTPSQDGYTATTEFEDHTLATQEISVKAIPGYTLSAAARLEGAGFEIAPENEQEYLVTPGEKITWNWSLSPRSAGRQRISISLMLYWTPQAAAQGPEKEVMLLNRGLEIQVTSFLGMGKPQAIVFGFFSIATSAFLGLWAWSGRKNPFRKLLLVVDPNLSLSIEKGPGMGLNRDEEKLIKALFRNYQRLILQNEFLSGYSGARTFLASPVHANGQADAETIIKIGPVKDIEEEYDHFESFVKNRLPPVTSRIQATPVTTRGSDRAALQYTCIAESGQSPVSLRQALLAHEDPAWIDRLFQTFGPYWWMQHTPYTFRMAAEYDRLLPPHLVLEPAAARGGFCLHPDLDPQNIHLNPGDLVLLSAFPDFSERADGKSITLYGAKAAGSPELRVRWLSRTQPGNTPARVVARRADLLRQYVSGFTLLGLPDPLQKLDTLLQKTISGTRSVIHGDLNLENILVGPGGLTWLIDFAQTREGHTLYDFSHLASELIAHVLVEKYPTPQAYLAALAEQRDPLLEKVERISLSLQFNPGKPDEYRLALILSCLGALKYQNLPPRAKEFLYLTAAYYNQ